MLAPLARMLHTPPVQAPSRIRSALEAMSRPRTAATVIAACVLLMMFAPLLFNALRLTALKVRYGDVAQQLLLVHAARDQVAVYRELDREKTWPMTKLLADIATNAPLGIELDLMRVDSGKDFSVSGTAISMGGKNPGEIVSQMLENLTRTDGPFNDIAMHVGEANNLGVYKFEITGKVPNPFRIATYPPERDFGAWTNPQRRDGVPAPSAKTTKPAKGEPDRTSLALANAAKTGNTSGSAAPANGETDSAPIPPVPAPAISASSDDNPDAEGADQGHRLNDLNRPVGAGADPTTSGNAVSGAEIPPPITAEQIKAMSLPELQQALAKVSKARNYNKSDAQLQERLKNEFTMLMDQMRKVKEKGGS